MQTFATLADFSAHAGQSLGETDYITITQEMVDLFAQATGDHQWIHTDPERAARESPYKTAIAHGFLTLSLAPKLMAEMYQVESVKMGVNYGGNKTRFLAPVRSGKRVRGHFKLLELAEKRPGQWQQTLEFTVEIEGEEKPALQAEWISQFFV